VLFLLEQQCYSAGGGGTVMSMDVESSLSNAAFVATHAGAFAWQVQLRTLYLSPNLESLMGFPPGGFDQRIDTLLDILNPQDRDRIFGLLKTLPPSQTRLESEFRIVVPVGAPRWFSARGEIVRDAGGEVERITGLAQEVSTEAVLERRMRMQQATLFKLLAEERIDTLPLQDALLRIAQRSAATLSLDRVSIWTYSGGGRWLDCRVLYIVKTGEVRSGERLEAGNYPNYFAALAQSRALAVAYAPTDFRTRELAADYLKPLGITSMLEAVIRRGGELIGVVCHEQVGPSREWTLDEQQFAASVADLVTLLLETNERQQLLECVEYQGNHDRLTGLPNRACFQQRLEQRVRAGEGRFALLLADVDRFQEINDCLGHAPGDEILVELGRRLTQLLPPDAVVARLDGDEFGVLLEGVDDAAQLTALVARLRGELHAPVSCQGMRLAIGVSVGASLFPLDARDTSALLRCADVALYQAKTSGGFSLYEAACDRQTPRRLTLMQDLVDAVENGELRADFQPQLDLRSGLVVGLEALARWTHPSFGEISPEEFIPLAEMSDLMLPLTLHMVRVVAEQWRRWQALGHDLRLAVNLAPGMLVSDAWVAPLLATLEAGGMPADRLELEVTESALVQEPQQANAILAQLTARGIRFSLDDFGVGFSSLTHLRHLPIHTIKIDKSFIQSLDSEPRLVAIVRSTLQLGANLGLDVIAEGVETAAIADLLRELGCTQCQGFHYSRPLAASDVPAFLAGEPRRSAL
jgi:diguanylate cyclase (GGDEF)-like protein